MVAGLVSAGGALAATTGWKVQPSPNPGGSHKSNFLSGVAATSSTNAWAVGSYYNGTAYRTLIERWNGKAWKVQLSPNRGNAPTLSAVAATSSTNAWAVGATAARTLIERWNGMAWKVVPSPNRGDTPGLSGVAATSSTNAWAVGSYFNGTVYRTLIERWNGNAWKVVPSPNGSSHDSILFGVAASSAEDAWAVGYYYDGSFAGQTLIERWNGKAWKVAPSVNPAGSSRDNILQGVTATSSTNAWATGHYTNNSFVGHARTLIERWNGKAWKVVPSPNPAGASNDDYLYGAAATSATNAWAAGFYYDGTAYRTLIERWNGNAWKIVPSPNLGGSSNDNYLYGVAARSAEGAWAVGHDYNGIADQTLIERWNGKG